MLAIKAQFVRNIFKMLNIFQIMIENGAKTNKFENFKGFFKPKTDKSNDKKAVKTTEEAPAQKTSWRGFFKTAAHEETAGKNRWRFLLRSMNHF